MKEYTKKNEMSTHCINSNLKSTKQASISRILQAYKDKTLDNIPCNNVRIIQCSKWKEFLIRPLPPLKNLMGVVQTWNWSEGRRSGDWRYYEDLDNKRFHVSWYRPDGTLTHVTYKHSEGFSCYYYPYTDTFTSCSYCRDYLISAWQTFCDQCNV